MTTKTKKPKKTQAARSVKARVMFTTRHQLEQRQGFAVELYYRPSVMFKPVPVAVLDISDPDALVEQAAKALPQSMVTYLGGTMEDYARAVLTSLGIISK